MLQLAVDNGKCIGCGECVAVCPYRVLVMDTGIPVVNPEQAEQCIQCQHCFAVCPTEALSVFGLNPEDSTALKGNLPDPEQVEVLMLGRRSTRRYKDKPVDLALLDRILTVVRNAPTGVNNRNVMLTLIDDPAVMQELRVRTYAGLRQAVDAGALPEGLEFFEAILNAYEEHGLDVLYRGAPHFLVASSPAAGPCPEADSLISLNYFELLANSHGIGTLWDGLAKWALMSIAPEVSQFLNIPADHAVGYMMIFGLPDVHYHRTVQRTGGVINRVTL